MITLPFFTQNILVERAGENDADLITIMVLRLLHEIHGQDLPTTDEQIHDMSRVLLEQGSSSHALLAYDPNRRPLGVMILSEAIALFMGGRFATITELFVDPQYRSQGVGEALLSAAKELADTQMWSRIEVSALAASVDSRALRFYHRNGFQECGQRLSLALSS